jgi:myo-inositol 2-dehydrogenase / D-chiro-inositol 1-dehydrogenase
VPGYARAKKKIEAGELGRIELFRALGRDTYPPSLEFLLGSGGIFLDMAVHDFDLARFLVGEVEEVQAWGTVLVEEKFAKAKDADTAVTLLRFVNGALGVVETSHHSSWGYDIRTEVAGAIGKVVVEAPQKTPLLFARDSIRVTTISKISRTALNRLIACSWSPFLPSWWKADTRRPGRKTPWRLSD